MKIKTLLDVHKSESTFALYDESVDQFICTGLSGRHAALFRKAPEMERILQKIYPKFDLGTPPEKGEKVVLTGDILRQIQKVLLGAYED